MVFDCCVGQTLPYTDYCVLSDVEMSVTVDSGWHPSHLETFDVHSKQTQIVLFRHNRNCMMSTNLTLSADKQVPARPRPHTPVILNVRVKLPL